MTVSVVLLRGVNLGAHNRVRMPDLVRVLEGTGCTDVRTYVQSGNAVVESPLTGGALEAAVRSALVDELGLDVPVMTRTADELDRVVRGCPWTGLDPKLLHVAFLSADPDPALVAAVDHDALLPERVVVGERALYLDHAEGVRNSRLARVRLGVDATARNWRTATALHELSRS